MKRILIPIVLLTDFFLARGEVKMERVEYQDGDTVLEGWVARDTALTGRGQGF